MQFMCIIKNLKFMNLYFIYQKSLAYIDTTNSSGGFFLESSKTPLWVFSKYIKSKNKSCPELATFFEKKKRQTQLGILDMKTPCS